MDAEQRINETAPEVRIQKQTLIKKIKFSKLKKSEITYADLKKRKAIY
ncbi:hypothetical protein [Clostridium tyrobutyricum]|nr:hypothetical protein [Clostridium tyrobutyricum]